MEKLDQTDATNETTSLTIEVNKEKEIIDDKNMEETSVDKIDNNLCELKEINCEIGEKNVKTSECCLKNECNMKCKIINDENKSNNTLKESQEKEEEEEENVDKCKQKLINEHDEEQKTIIKECCNLDNNLEDVKKKSCQSIHSKSKETASGVTCTKQKRKSRSTRKRLNAMINNSSMHFSDTDSEGELVIMENYGRPGAPPPPLPGGSPIKLSKGPIISVTMDDIENVDKSDRNYEENLTITSTPVINRSRCGSYVENLTDIDEIYSSDLETEQHNNHQTLSDDDRKKLTINEINNCQIDTDIEDLSNDEIIEQPIIYLTPRMDDTLLYGLGGETITTKEGDGPFSIEIRNRMSKEFKSNDNENYNSFDNPTTLPNTDSEDMEMSDDNDNDNDDIPKASSSQRVLYDDLDVLVASQIIMTNVNKTDNMLGVKDNQDDLNIADSHTDVEDVD